MIFVSCGWDGAEILFLCVTVYRGYGFLLLNFVICSSDAIHIRSFSDGLHWIELFVQPYF